MDDLKLKIVEPTSTEGLPEKPPNANANDEFLRLLNNEEGMIQPRRPEGWHQPKKIKQKKTKRLLKAQASKTLATENERTAQMAERKGFLSGFLDGGKASFLWSLGIGGVMLLVFKLYQLDKGAK